MFKVTMHQPVEMTESAADFMTLFILVLLSFCIDYPLLLVGTVAAFQ